jgi:hypothetical protein
MINRTLSASERLFRSLQRDRLVGEDADPKPAVALEDSS